MPPSPPALVWLTVALSLSFSARSAAQSARPSYSNCHPHGTVQYCEWNGVETAVSTLTSARSTGSATITSPPSTASAASAAAAAAQTTAVTSCHAHGDNLYCIDGTGNELKAVVSASVDIDDAPSSYTECHAHDADLYCHGSDSQETLFVAEAAAATTAGAHDDHDDDHDHDGESEASTSGARSCHFHAGVEHCVGGEAATTCERVDRDYNVPLRIGTLFAILVTCAMGVFAPIFLSRFSTIRSSFTIIKQFGTGIIISTALIHLLTHAQLMFANECLGRLSYEATTTAIVIAGAFITFLCEYLAHRVVEHRTQRSLAQVAAQPPVENKGDATGAASSSVSANSLEENELHGIAKEDKVTVAALEAGIIFHSIILGVTLVVAGDSAYIVLFIVILFHQIFEGLALGARIAALSTSLLTKCIMASAFAITTPLGMAIGIGVLDHFNGNDKSTIVAIGTLDAFSAGILIWTGFVSMWAHDWMYGELRNASLVRTTLSLFSLMAGIILMSVLGKWA